jgi:K+-sensing histidine kinase KdpD
VSDPGSGDKARQRGGFLGFIAHEVRNPLSTALWSAELLSRMAAEDRGGARGEKLSGMCLRSISRVRQLVEDHFLCERLDAGGLALRVEALSARELAEGLLERTLKDGGEVALDVPEGLAVRADRTLLDRALESLVAAAARDGAGVRLHAHADHGAVRVEVFGAPPLPGAIDDPVKGTPSDQRGRALAVPLARRIAEALGGSLGVTQEGYVLSLPQAEAYAPRPEPAAPP